MTEQEDSKAATNVLKGSLCGNDTEIPGRSNLREYSQERSGMSANPGLLWFTSSMAEFGSERAENSDPSLLFGERSQVSDAQREYRYRRAPRSRKT